MVIIAGSVTIQYSLRATILLYNHTPPAASPCAAASPMAIAAAGDTCLSASGPEIYLVRSGGFHAEVAVRRARGICKGSATCAATKTDC